MRVGETNPLLRRIYGVIYLDDGVTVATDADVSPPVGALQVTVNGAAVTTATGSFVGDGAGEYYYELSASEVLTPGFVGFKFERTGYQTEWFLVDVGDLWVVGEMDTSKLRQPMVVRDDSAPPQLAHATVTSPSQLQTSLNGVTFANAAGTLGFVAAGLHYYQGTIGDAAVEGTLLIRFAKTGFQTEVVWADVALPESVLVPASLTSLSPSPNVSPGDPGGFPPAPLSAASTPVVAVVANGALNLDRILVTFVVDGVEEIAYYSGVLRGRYVSGSSQTTSGNDLTLSFRREGGWSTTSGQMVVTIEGVTPDLFHMVLPTTSTPTALAATVTTTIDHAEAMLSRLPSQFRGKPKIENLVRRLAKPIQQLSDVMDYVEAHYDVDNAFGSRLKTLARRVGQPTDGVPDDDTLRRLVRARIAANRSSGTVNQLIRIIRLVIDSPATDVSVSDRGTATTVVLLLGTSISSALATSLLGILRRAKSSAVRLKIVYSNTAPTFRFHTGPGFHIGHLASVAE